MINCPNCNKELADGTRFCDTCGTAIPEATQEAVTYEVQQPVYEAQQTQEAAPAAEKKDVLAVVKNVLGVVKNAAEKTSDAVMNLIPENFRQKLPRLTPVYAVAALVLLVVVCLIGGSLIGGGKHNYALYIKDGELVYHNLSKKGDFEVTSKLIDGEGFNSNMTSLSSQIGMFVTFSEDGKRIFYPDKISESGMTLYYRSTTNPKKDEEKIAADVEWYTINKAGNKVLYLSDNTLYFHNLKDKEKIDKDVRGFQTTEDFKKILYRTTENDIYYGTVGKECEKIAKEISSLTYVADDLSFICYTKDNDLYIQKTNKDDDEKIAKDVVSVVAVYGAKDIYYITSESEEATLIDYIVDDMKDSDANMTKPEYPEYPQMQYPDSPTYPSVPSYPFSWDYATTEEYDAAVEAYNTAYAAYEVEYNRIREEYQQAYDKAEEDYKKAKEEYQTAYDAYQEASNAWYAKENRDSLREKLADSKMDTQTATLYHYNGKDSKVVAENVDADSFTKADEKAVILVRTYDAGNVEKVKLSEIEYAYEVREKVENALSESVSRSLVVDETLIALDNEDASNYKLLDDGSAIYYVEDVEDGHGTLYKQTIKGTKLGKAEEIDDEVYASTYYVTEDNKPAYFKDVENGSGEFYYAGKEVEDDVYLSNIQFDDKKVYFFTDFDAEKREGTLNIYKGGKSEEIEDDIRSFKLTEGGYVLMIQDFDSEKGEGDLLLYKGGKAQELDDGISGLVYVYSREIRTKYGL